MGRSIGHISVGDVLLCLLTSHKSQEESESEVNSFHTLIHFGNHEQFSIELQAGLLVASELVVGQLELSCSEELGENARIFLHVMNAALDFFLRS